LNGDLPMLKYALCAESQQGMQGVRGGHWQSWSIGELFLGLGTIPNSSGALEKNHNMMWQDKIYGRLSGA